MQRLIIIILIAFVLVVVFALQNAEPVLVKLYFWEVQSSLSLIITLILAIGAILGAVIAWPKQYMRKKELKSLKKELEKLKGLQPKISKPEEAYVKEAGDKQEKEQKL